jgi:hypothetical protein
LTTTQKKQHPIVYIVSDSIGETAELVTRAATSQFNSGNAEIRRFPFVNNVDEIVDIVQHAAKDKSLIIFTLVMPNLKEILLHEANKHNVIVVDILGPALDALKQLTGKEPHFEPGLIRRVNEEYFKRVEAIEFAVKYDDGKDPRGITKADIIVMGVSRTGKTPLCMYLAHKGIKTANIPLVPEIEVPEEIFSVPARHIVGLMIQPDYLIHIRQERLVSLGLPAGAQYAKPERIYKELEYAQEVMQKIGCPIIDVTKKAVEETANKVLEIYYKTLRSH